MKILITGGSGLLGQYLNIELYRKNEILTLYHSNPGNCKNYNSHQLDLTDYKKLADLFRSNKPDVVVHTAAVSRSELADSYPKEYVTKINVGVCAVLAELCKENKSRLIYTSTDLVYNGEKGSILKEEAELKPVSLYAETKLMGENIIKEIFDDYIILRTALMYGFGLNHSTNHFQQMYKNLQEGEKVKLFYDQFRTPLSLPEAARLIGEMINMDIFPAILNFGGKERVSRFELGEILCNEAGFDKSLLIRFSMTELKDFPAVPDVSMNIDQLTSLGLHPESISESIRRMLPALEH